MNSLPAITTRKQHARYLALLMKVASTFQGGEGSAVQFLRELAERVEAYEKAQWPIATPSKRRKK